MKAMLRPSKLLLFIALTVAAGACRQDAAAGPSGPQPGSRPAGTELAPEVPEGRAVATFAGGCFWCMEKPFDDVEGVQATWVGYTGGDEEHPTYKQVAYGKTGHAESIRVVYDPKKVSYERLLDVFWRNVNPTDPGGQFVDRGRQYRTGIFVHDPAQRKAAEASKKKLSESGRFDGEIVTPIEEAGPFWLAEDYHQDFYRKSPAHYRRYRSGSGRDSYLEKIWGAESKK